MVVWFDLFCSVLFCVHSLFFFYIWGKNERTSKTIYEQDGTSECVSASDATSENNNVLCHNCGNIVLLYYISLSLYYKRGAHNWHRFYSSFSKWKCACIVSSSSLSSTSSSFFPLVRPTNTSKLLHIDMKYKHGIDGKKSIWMKNVMNESLCFKRKIVKLLSFSKFISAFDV